MNEKKIKDRANRLIDEFDIRTPSSNLPAGSYQVEICRRWS